MDFDKNKLVIGSKCTERFSKVLKAVSELVSDEKREQLIIGIDGKCASGKTTLGYLLCSLYDCNIFHMDDFFLQDYQRTNERLKEVGGNVDYERFKEEVVDKLLAGKAVEYRPFSCKERRILQGEFITPKRINIIEGSYCMHPYFGAIYDLRVFTDIGENMQLENIKKRNGEQQLARFKEEWIPKENAYFESFGVRDGCVVCEWIGK